MVSIVDFRAYKDRNPVASMCYDPAARYSLFGFMIGILRAENEHSEGNETVERLYGCLDESSKKLVEEYASEELQKVKMM